MVDPIFINTSEAARLLGVSPSTLEKWRFYNVPDRPQAIRLGRAIRYKVDDLRAWADERAKDCAQ